MGRPIRTTAPVVFYAGTATTGMAAAAGLNALTTSAIAKPVQLGGASTALLHGTGTAANTNAFWDYTGSFSINDKKGLEFWIYVDMTGATAKNSAFVGTVTMFDAGFANSLTTTMQVKHGWNLVRLSRADFGAGAGSAVWATTTFTVIRFKLNAVSGVTHSFWMCDLSYAGYSRPQVAVMFDDGYSSVIDTAYPVMAARGIVGTVAVIKDKVGDAGYMTEANLATLHAAGWALVNHSDTHGAEPFLASATQAECLAEIEACRDYLEGLGYTRDDEHLHYCSPYGEWSTNYLAAATEAGCVMFRGLFGDQAASAMTPNGMADSGVREQMIASVVPTDAWTAANVTARTSALVSSGRSAIYVFHNIVTPADTTIKMTPANFTLIMDDLYRKKGMLDTVTLPKFREALYDPTV